MGLYDGQQGLFTISEFYNRGIIKLAPDALVFISGNFETMVTAPVSGATQRVDFKEGITAISVQNNVDPPGSSTASIEITAPLYNEKSRYWVNFRGYDGRLYRRCFFVPMMEVKIFFKGRYLDHSGYNIQPRYYPAFWGFITQVEESYSGGSYKIVLNCVDMLAWWGRIQVAFKPSVESDVFTGGLQGLTAYASRYIEANPFEVIYSLVTEMGYENFITPSWLGMVTPSSNIFSRAEINVIWGGILDYWKKRWQGIIADKRHGANLLKMYGACGNLIYDPTRKNEQYPTNPQKQTSTNDNSANPAKASIKSGIFEGFTVNDRLLYNFKVFHEFEGMGQLEQAEYQDKLQIATEVKNRIEYEFFQDVNGNFIFKPPFYNLNVKPLLPYRIKPCDILNYSFGVNSDEIVTCLEVQLSIHQQIRKQEWTNLIGYHIDMDLAKKYGHRFKKICLWYASETDLARALAVGHLSLQNVKAFSGSVTIPGRPELRLGYPIYMEHRDTFHYVKTINHSFDYAGSFTTTLALEAERQQAYEYNPETKRFENLKNMVYNLKCRVSLPPNKSLKKGKTTKDQTKETNVDSKIEELARGADYISSLIPGRYGLAKGTPEQQAVTPTTVPYSDEEGYRVIGSFRYGRGIIVKPGLIPELICDPVIENNQTAEQVEQRRQALMVTNIKTIADEEAEALASYSRVNIPGEIESLIPRHLDLDSEIFKKRVDEVIIPYEEEIRSMNVLTKNVVLTNTEQIGKTNQRIQEKAK